MIGIVSLYANPLHLGHIEYIQAAAKNCNFLVAIVNNDEQVKLKGTYPMMDEEHRAVIVYNIKDVDAVYISFDEDESVANTLAYVADHYKGNPIIFFNSGDRDPDSWNEKEVEVCKEYLIAKKFIPLEKKYSSREFRNAECVRIESDQ